VARQHGMHEFAIQRRTALCGRREEPEDQGYLHLVVERQPGDEDVRECFDAGEKCKDNPVHHPFYLKTDTYKGIQ